MNGRGASSEDTQHFAKIEGELQEFAERIKIHPNYIASKQ